VLAVEAREGSDAALARGGTLGNGNAIAAKVSKKGQDPRFDLPVIGPKTIETAFQAGIKLIVVEARVTMIMQPEITCSVARDKRIAIWGLDAESVSNYKSIFSNRI